MHCSPVACASCLCTVKHGLVLIHPAAACQTCHTNSWRAPGRASGPLSHHQAFCAQGFLQTALVVSSFHVLDIEAADSYVERTVRILYGEGDRYGCWLDVAADNIVWHELSDPSEGRPASEAPAGDAADKVRRCSSDMGKRAAHPGDCL